MSLKQIVAKPKTALKKPKICDTLSQMIQKCNMKLILVYVHTAGKWNPCQIVS